MIRKKIISIGKNKTNSAPNWKKRWSFKNNWNNGQPNLYLKLMVVNNFGVLLNATDTFGNTSKAFDRVWPREFMRKNRSYWHKGFNLEWVNTFLFDRRQRVVIHNNYIIWVRHYKCWKYPRGQSCHLLFHQYHIGYTV